MINDIIVYPGVCIRTTTQTLKNDDKSELGVKQTIETYKKSYSRTLRRNRKKVIRYGLLTINVVLLVSVTFFVTQSGSNSGSVSQNVQSNFNSNNSIADNPLDQISSADIAVNLSRVTNLEESIAVSNKADTVNAQLAITSADDVVIAKPQIVSNGLKSKKDIQRYSVVPGDSVSSLAVKFGVTSDSIRWSNGLSGDSIVPGSTILIPPVNGIVYQVKAGDDVDSLASRYRANRDYIAVFNNTEVEGLPVGGLILIPDGIQPSAGTGTRNYVASSGFPWGGSGPVYASNGYDYGYCTWWAAVRRAQIGRPIPSNLGNASTWKSLAQRSGLGVGGAPSAGAVIWTNPRDYYGHVGFVESVNPDGSVNVSEMNVAGWGRVSRKTLSPEQATAYSYIY